jgi:hypothetical protein
MKLQRRAPVELKPPEAFSRRVLLCVTGLSPQVVTETLYALARQEPAFIPTEVHVITTSTGADMITRKLIARPDGKFHQLCREHIAGHRIRFDNACIHVIKSKGRALSDILTVDDNLAVADTTAPPRANMTCATYPREISEQRGRYDDQPAVEGPDARSEGFCRSGRIARSP